jgi:exosortase D (VPLPA-CTERM-specific)
LAGFVVFGIGILLYWLGELGGEFFTLYMSFWFVILGIAWVHNGWEKIRTVWFSFIMMLAMFPFPDFINVRITLKLKLLSSWLGVWMLQLYGMSAYREGNVIDLGFTELQVVDACSGLRYVMPLAVLGLLLAYWFKAHWWKRVLLFLSSVPLAIFVNSFRIAATGVLHSMFGAKVAEGFFHGFSGWLIFMFAIPCLLAEMWILRRIPPKHKMEDGRGKREASDATANGDRETENLKGVLLQPKFIVAIAILLVTFGLSHGIEFRQKVPISKPFSQFPMQIGEWRGAREDMEQQFLDQLKFSDYIMANYANSQGKTVNFYVAYYQDQSKGEAIHSPETCFPSSGCDHPCVQRARLHAGEPGFHGAGRRQGACVLLVPHEGPHPDEALSIENIHLLGFADETQDRWGAGEGHHAGLSERAATGYRGQAARFCAGGHADP